MKYYVKKFLTYLLSISIFFTILPSCLISSETANAFEEIRSSGGSVYFGSYMQDLVTDEAEITFLKEQTFTDNKLYTQGIHYEKKGKDFLKMHPLNGKF